MAPTSPRHFKSRERWTPAFAGVTKNGCTNVDPFASYRTTACAARLASRSTAASWIAGVVANIPNASPLVEL